MLDTILISFVFVFLLLLWKYRRPNNYPPGPTPVPFLGNVFQLPEGHMYQATQQWAKKYGPIIGISVADQLIVLITGVDNVIDAMRKEEFQSRPVNLPLKDRSFGKTLGIFFGNGEQWSSSRKFTIKHMRAFGKAERENVIADEISRLMETFKDGSTIQGTGIFGVSAVNVIWTVIANRRIDFNDERSKTFLKNIFIQFRLGRAVGGDWVNLVPSLRFLSSKYRLSFQITKDLQGYIREVIQEHREVLDPNNPMDLIDHYLVEMEHKESQNPLFSEEDLIMIVFDLFSAGAESVSNSIEFVLLYMVLYPEMQKKMQEELDRVLGRSRKPVLEDKNELHYTMAVLNEVERSNTIAPSSVPHCCTKDTTFGGHFIPKDTMISFDLWSLGHDPKYWKNPDEFNPERFLNADGKYTKSPIFHSFGLGQRVCVGEMFSRNIIFLFATTFFEKFFISLPPGDPQPSTDALPGFTTAPKPFRVTIKSRY